MNTEDINYLNLSVYDSVDEYRELVDRDNAEAEYADLIRGLEWDDEFGDDVPDWQLDLIAEQEGWGE